MKKKLSLSLLLSTIFLFLIVIISNNNSDNNANNKIKIVATIFPNYDFAKIIAGDKAEVSLLLPPGLEAHSFNPKPKDIVKIKSSDIFIYTGKYMEPWAEKFINSSNNKTLIICDSSYNVLDTDSNSDIDDHHHHELNEESNNQDHFGHNHDSKHDPHIWLDPILAKNMVDNITNSIIKADSKNKDYYIKNAINFKLELDILHKNIQSKLKKTKIKTIIYTGHFAFGHFIKRYNLEYISPYKGFSPNAEPSPQNISKLINLTKEINVDYIFYEDLVDPKIANIISSETNTKILILKIGQNISKDDLKNNISYISIMNKNLENLLKGLKYEE